MRECFAVVWRERHHAKLAGDVLCQTRAWNLFCLVPKMLLHRPRNTGSLGRDELSQRVVAADPRSERVFVTPQSRSTKNTRGRSHSKGSYRPEQSAEGAGVKSPSGFDWSCLCAEEFGNVGCIAEQTPTRTDLRHSTGGAGFSTHSGHCSWTQSCSRSVCVKSIWIFSRTWRVHQRDVEVVPGGQRLVCCTQPARILPAELCLPQWAEF